MRLNEFAPPTSSTGVSYNASVVSPIVGDIQNKLVKLGYDLGPPGVDGKYGDYTKAAITAFKTDYKLGSNGSFMLPEDIDVLNKVLSGNIPRVSSPTKPNFSGISQPSSTTQSVTSGGGSWINRILSGLGLGGSGGTTGSGPSNLTWRPGVDQRVKPELLNLLSKLQVEFGKPFTITSGYRSPKRNTSVGGAFRSKHLTGEAVDISWPSSESDTNRLIALASKLGFGGIGVYKPGSVHLDIRPGRMGWGRGYGRGSWPSWANQVMQAHMGSGFNFGKFAEE